MSKNKSMRERQFLTNSAGGKKSKTKTKKMNLTLISHLTQKSAQNGS
jgi:hypothetical protein